MYVIVPPIYSALSALKSMLCIFSVGITHSTVASLCFPDSSALLLICDVIGSAVIFEMFLKPQHLQSGEYRRYQFPFTKNEISGVICFLRDNILTCKSQHFKNQEGSKKRTQFLFFLKLSEFKLPVWDLTHEFCMLGLAMLFFTVSFIMNC